MAGQYTLAAGRLQAPLHVVRQEPEGADGRNLRPTPNFPLPESIHF